MVRTGERWPRERPSDPEKLREWDSGVREIEGYRERNGVVDRDSALGSKPQEHSKAHEHRQAQRQIEQRQRQLQLQRQRVREQSIDLGIGR